MDYSLKIGRMPQHGREDLCVSNSHNFVKLISRFLREGENGLIELTPNPKYIYCIEHR